MNTNFDMSKVFSGSCTPGCDLESAIERGDVSREAANTEIRRRYSSVRTVGELAESERAYVQHYNI